MQLTFTTALALAALTCLASANTCKWSVDPNANGALRFQVTASGVTDIPGICGGLWDNLHRFPLCIVQPPNGCEDQGDGNLLWYMQSPGCNDGMIESAWWEATKNKFGAIECVQVG